MTRQHMYIAGGFVAGIIACKGYQYFMGVRAQNAAAAAAPGATAPIRANSSQVGVTN